MKYIFLSVLLAFTFGATAQILQPAKWTYQTSSDDIKIGQTIELIFKVKIDDNWYLYSNEFPCEDGPIKTSINFKPHTSYQLEGKLKAVKPTLKYDDIFECEVSIFKHYGEFRQTIKILNTNLVIEGDYEYQVCSEVDGKCIPGGEDFSFSNILESTRGGSKNNKKEQSSQEELPNSPDQETSNGEKDSSLPLVSNSETDWDASKPVQGPILDKSIPEGKPDLHSESFLGYLFFAFLLGLTSLITPCVFPMLPMTVTFFLKDNVSKSRALKKALIFGLSIIIIYTSAGSLFAILLGTDGLNALATHWAPNLFVFAIFIVFALSFFGLFEINAPYKLVNTTDRQVEKGGLLGIFFLAATLVLVSFSCTVPLVGSVLFLTAGGEFIKPVLSLFFYSFAFAIPFTVFAVFPEWIKGLPKSGGWLNSVKVSLGFIELALCLKFFSIADQAYHWGILDRDFNITLWIVIFGMLGFYLLGKLPMKGDTPIESISVSRLFLSLATFSFVVYLIPGLWGAPLKMLAGYLPPTYTSDFDLISIAGKENSNTICDKPKYSEFLHLPHGLKGYFDYNQALACSRQQNKPLFIDFTGHGCTNCREMESVVWSDPQVLQILKNDFVVVALYVDDKTELPQSEWFISKYDQKWKKTIGKKNADLQIRNLENNAQPFYVLVGKDERVLAWPYSFDRDPKKFVAFLESGKRKYRELYRK